MARSGRFGRSPRSAPSLTSTIVAIAREFQTQRDTNIMNAWEKGGMFEGKKATDELVLAHWKERVNGVSKDDPLHDTYQNAVTQLDYTIHESKMTAAYALSHKTPADDHKMVAFYLGWAKKIPKDSEFYRTLQRDAGQYMRTVNNNNKAAAAAAKEKAYQDQQAETDKKFGAAGAFLTDTLRRLNQSGFADGHLAPTLDAPGTGSRNDLTDFNPQDPEESMKLLGLIAPHNVAGDAIRGKPGTIDAAPDSPNGKVLYHSDTIDPKTKQPKGVTGADIVAQLAKFDPTFKPGEPIDVPYLTGLLDRQNMGLQQQIDLATKTGHQTDAEQLTKQKGYIATLTRQVAAWPVEKAYLDIEDTFEKVSLDSTASPMAVEKARAAKNAALAGLVGDKRIAANDNFRSRLQDEIDGKNSGPTLKESFTGSGSGQDSQHGAFMQGQQAQNEKDIEEVNRDSIKLPGDPTKLVWTFGKTVQGQFTPDPNGREIGKATVSDVSASGLNPTTVTINDARGGKGIQVMVTAVPVNGIAVNPADGKRIAPQNNQPIAWAYNIPNGDQNNVSFGYLVKDPTDPTKTVMHFSDASNPPWDPKLEASPSSSGGNHYEVDFSSYLPTAAATSGAPGSTSLSVDLTKGGSVAVNGPDGKPITGFNVDMGDKKPTLDNPNPKGDFTWDPYTVARNSDTGRNALGGTDPVTDFTSLTVSNLLSSGVDGQTILKNLDQHSEFKTQVTDDGMNYAGATRLPDGTWDTTTANVAKLSQAEQQSNIMKGAAALSDVVKNGAAAWQRLTTGSPYPGNQTPNGTQPNFMSNPLGAVTKLATDLVKGTPFEPISHAFVDGTLTKKPADTSSQQRDFNIFTGNAIKTPTYTPKNIVTQQTTQVGTPGGTTQYQPGSTPTPAPQPQAQPPAFHKGPKAL